MVRQQASVEDRQIAVKRSRFAPHRCKQFTRIALRVNVQRHHRSILLRRGQVHLRAWLLGQLLILGVFYDADHFEREFRLAPDIPDEPFANWVLTGKERRASVSFRMTTPGACASSAA